MEEIDFDCIFFIELIFKSLMNFAIAACVNIGFTMKKLIKQDKSANDCKTEYNCI